MARTGRPKGKENRPLTDAQIRRNITFEATGHYAVGGISASKKMIESGTHPFSNSEMRKKYQHKINEANRGRVQPLEERIKRGESIKAFYDSMTDAERKQFFSDNNWGSWNIGKKHTSERVEKRRQSLLEYIASLTKEQRKEKYGGTEESRKRQVETRRKNNNYTVSEETRKKIQKSCGAQVLLQFVYDKTNDDGFGKFVKEWPSRNEARNEYGNGVGGVIKGTSKHCKGFKFIYLKDYKTI
jgi:hypothetical protein